MESVLVKNQEKTFVKSFNEDGDNKKITVTIRFDDRCGNGKNSFSITGEIYNFSLRSRDKVESCGCIHDDIEKHFPELKEYIPFHLMSANEGPMHYVANALYFASDKDHWGKRKGEEKDFKTSIYFNDVPLPHDKYSEKFIKFIQENDISKLEIKEFKREKTKDFNYEIVKYSFNDFCDVTYRCPFDDKDEAENFLLALKNCKIEYKTRCIGWGEGKEPELDKARYTARWPEAELKDFTKENLEKRLPMLLENLKNAVEKLGMVY